MGERVVKTLGIVRRDKQEYSVKCMPEVQALGVR